MKHPEDAQKQLGFWETTGSVLWFAMDSCWMLEVNRAALLMIAPTLFANLLTLRYLAGFAERLVGWATLCWLGMNVAWMSGEILGLGLLHQLAKIFSVVGFALLIVVIANARQTKAAWHERLRRFRRLRIRS